MDKTNKWYNKIKYAITTEYKYKRLLVQIYNNIKLEQQINFYIELSYILKFYVSYRYNPIPTVWINK